MPHTDLILTWEEYRDDWVSAHYADVRLFHRFMDKIGFGSVMPRENHISTNDVIAVLKADPLGFREQWREWLEGQYSEETGKRHD